MVIYFKKTVLWIEYSVALIFVFLAGYSQNLLWARKKHVKCSNHILFAMPLIMWVGSCLHAMSIYVLINNKLQTAWHYLKKDLMSLWAKQNTMITKRNYTNFFIAFNMLTPFNMLAPLICSLINVTIMQ